MFDSGTKVKMKFVVFERELFTFSRRQEKRERRERGLDIECSRIRVGRNGEGFLELATERHIESFTGDR